MQPILTRLRAIFDLVIMFQHKQSSMITECLKEVERRTAAKEEMERRTKQVCEDGCKEKGEWREKRE